MGDQSRERNPNWKGGRTRTRAGYWLVRVGREHHLADVRGYAYEHRLVAEQVVGRRLRKGEQVHHINGDRGDNRPGNIEVAASRAHHAVHHRTRRDGEPLRLPGEDNPSRACLCGCGSTFPKFDATNRPRRYLPGHNLHPQARAL